MADDVSEEYKRGYVAGLRARRGRLGSNRNEDRRTTLYNLMTYYSNRALARTDEGKQSGHEQQAASALEEALRRWDKYERLKLEASTPITPE